MGSEGSKGSARSRRAGSEGCGIAIGHACGVRVQRVQKVQRVQRGRYRPAGDEYEVSVTELSFMSTLLHNGVL